MRWPHVTNNCGQTSLYGCRKSEIDNSVADIAPSCRREPRLIPAAVFVLTMLAWSAPGTAVLIPNLTFLATLMAALAWIVLRFRANALVAALVAFAGLHRSVGPYLAEPLQPRIAGIALVFAAILFAAATLASRLLARFKHSRQRWMLAPACGLLLAACATITSPPDRKVEAGSSLDAMVNNKMTSGQWLNLSLEAFRAKHYLEAIAAAQTSVRLQPDFAEAHNNLAASYSALKLWDLAIPEAQEAIRLRPDFGLARNNLAWALEQKRLETQSH